jgi:signal transduction histidine kinase
VVLENVRLYQLAREATQARDELMSVVAHDLRNPLSTIAMHGARLRQNAGDEAVSGEAIQRSVARMARLIDDLLDVTRIQAGRISIERESVDTNAFLQELAGSQRPLAESASIELVVQAPPDLPPVWADRHRLSQAFENLVGNALKYTGPGGHITLGAEVDVNEVRFMVRDSGSGIALEHLPHVFDRFWQAQRTARRSAGLGLAIVKGIVDAHDGTIRAESTPGQGAAFFFSIPKA